LAWALACHFLEYPIEVRKVIEATLEAKVSYTYVLFTQQLASMCYAVFVDKLGEGTLGMLLEVSAKCWNC